MTRNTIGNHWPARVWEEVESINKWEAWQGRSGAGAGTLIILTYSYYQHQDSDQR